VHQVARICELLESSGDVHRLATFLWSLPAEAELCRHESVVRARALVAQHACTSIGNFSEIVRLLAAVRHFTQARILKRFFAVASYFAPSKF